MSSIPPPYPNSNTNPIRNPHYKPNNSPSFSYNFQSFSDLFPKHKSHHNSNGSQTITTNFQSTQTSLANPPPSTKSLPIKTILYNDLLQTKSIKSLTITKISPRNSRTFHKRCLTNSFCSKVPIPKPQTPKYEKINTLTSDPSFFDTKMNTINSYIHTIKHCKVEKMNNRINNKHKKKMNISYKVDELHSCVSYKNVLSRHRCCNVKGIEKETDRIRAMSMRMARERFYIQKEIPGIRKEIRDMKRKIYMLNKDTEEKVKGIKELEEEVVEVKKNAQDVHNMIHEVVMQKEKIQNLIQVYKKQAEMNKQKAMLTVKGSNGLIENIYAFAKDAYEEDKLYND